MADPTTDDLLRALEKHETTIAELYALLGERLEDTRALWDRLVLDEQAHAEIVGMLREQLQARGLLVNTRKFNMAALRSSTEYVGRHMADVQTRGTTTLRALSLASGIEHAIIEKEFYMVYESDSTEMKKEFQELYDHTQLHRKLVDEYLDAERRKKSVR